MLVLSFCTYKAQNYIPVFCLLMQPLHKICTKFRVYIKSFLIYMRILWVFMHSVKSVATSHCILIYELRCHKFYLAFHLKKGRSNSRWSRRSPANTRSKYKNNSWNNVTDCQNALNDCQKALKHQWVELLKNREVLNVQKTSFTCLFQELNPYPLRIPNKGFKMSIYENKLQICR